MKKFATLFTICFVLLFAGTITAQNKCCLGTTIAPELNVGFYNTPIMLDGDYTPAPMLGITGSADLPNTEYIITKRNTKALNEQGTPDTTGGGGDVILGADADGVFRPIMTRYNIHLSPGDTFDITAVGYDLAIIKNLADSLLNGYSGSTPCCDLFGFIASALSQPALAGFCDSVNKAHIYTANDIHGMNEVLAIFDVFATQTSVATLISTLTTINSNGTLISAQCGGTGQNNFVPYGINKDKKYGYTREGTVAVNQLSPVSLFAMFPNPATDDVQLNFTTSQQVDLNINVYDALGQRVYAQTLGNTSGSINTQIPLSNFASGMYYVELTDGHSSQTHKLMVK